MFFSITSSHQTQISSSYNLMKVKILPFFIIYYKKYYRHEKKKPEDETDQPKNDNSDVKTMDNFLANKSPRKEVLNKDFSNDDLSGFNHISSSPVGVSKSKKRLSIPNFSDLPEEISPPKKRILLIPESFTPISRDTRFI